MTASYRRKLLVASSIVVLVTAVPLFFGMKFLVVALLLVGFFLIWVQHAHRCEKCESWQIYNQTHFNADDHHPGHGNVVYFRQCDVCGHKQFLNSWHEYHEPVRNNRFGREES